MKRHDHGRSPCSPYAGRRAAFARRMGAGVAVIASAAQARRNGDVSYEFRQDSDFYYLTGFEEPEAVAVIAPGHPKHRFVLFVRPRDPAMEVWNGPRAGVAGARRRHGADAAYPIAELDQVLPQYLGNTERLFHKVGRDAAFDEKIIGIMNRLRAQAGSGMNAPSSLEDPYAILAEMRLFKGAEELESLRKAISLTDEGHRAAMAFARPGRWEFEVQAEMEKVFRSGGSPRLGYPSIVGGGNNATVLHYTANNQRLKDDDLLLIDAGTEFGYYTADVTRTFPVSGRFTPEQKAVYEVVLESQEEAIRKCRPGVSFRAVHEAAVEVLVEGCKRLGLLKGPARQLIRKKTYGIYYMHNTSHWLGMDVHDAGRYKEDDHWRKLKPGMVLTVEPGLYFPGDCRKHVQPGCRRALERYLGIGVRIEDDILITKDGHENLSGRIPKGVEEMEAMTGV